jgi:signal transduction histidine kinase
MNTITPITSISDSILRFCQIDDKGLPLPLDQEKMSSAVRGLEVIRSQGNDLMEFVQSYRSFLNVPRPDKKLVSIARLFEKAKVLMQQDLEDRITFHWESKPDDLELFIDEKQVTQVLVNLIKNAIHSLENIPAGRIDVLAGIDANGRKFLKVMDNGPGIPTELTQEIFVPFFTTKEKGTGIGLSLSRQIMQLHEGTLQVHSLPDTETVFTLKF